MRLSLQGNHGVLEFHVDVLEDPPWCDALGTVWRFDQIVARPALLLPAVGIGESAWLIKTPGLG